MRKYYLSIRTLEIYNSVYSLPSVTGYIMEQAMEDIKVKFI